jgi:outer membrane protein assembly factor BamB
MVSAERGLVDSFAPGERQSGGSGQIDVETTRQVKWIAKLGDRAHGSPVVAGGRVFVGTNNNAPRDPRIQGDKGVLMCFSEQSGEFLWQLVVPKMYELKYSDWHNVGICSSPTVEGDRVYVVSNRCEVVCLDAKGMSDGNDGPYREEGRHMVVAGEEPLEPSETDADILWLYDMVAELDVFPHNASNCSILLDGNLLYVCTSNGVDWTHTHVVSPHAPTMIVLDKTTGKLVARDDFGIGEDIVHGQWSSPALGCVGDRRVICIGAGDACVYAFEALDPQTPPPQSPLKLKNLWKFNGEPLAQTQDHVPRDHQHDTVSYLVTAMPVFHGDRVYVAITQEPYHQKQLGYLACLDATLEGDVTRKALKWKYEGTGASVSTVSVADGLVYIADFAGRVHCLDAESGRCYWVYEAGNPIWGSTFVADGKVYIGTGRYYFCVLRAGKELTELARVRMRDGVLSTPTAANGALYVATNRHLYAIAADGQASQ